MKDFACEPELLITVLCKHRRSPLPIRWPKLRQIQRPTPEVLLGLNQQGILPVILRQLLARAIGRVQIRRQTDSRPKHRHMNETRIWLHASTGEAKSSRTSHASSAMLGSESHQGLSNGTAVRQSPGRLTSARARANFGVYVLSYQEKQTHNHKEISKQQALRARQKEATRESHEMVLAANWERDWVPFRDLDPVQRLRPDLSWSKSRKNLTQTRPTIHDATKYRTWESCATQFQTGMLQKETY